MEYRRLGSSGLKLSALSLGSWVTFGNQVAEDTAEECMVAAYEEGVNFFDGAEGYADGRAETVIGRVLQRVGWKRSDLVLSTKIYWGGQGPNDRGLSRKHIIEGCEAALDRLQTEYVDLVYCHRTDPETPIEETVWAMSDLVRQGLAFYWGTSNWSAREVMEAYWIARREHLIPPTMEQPQYNMFHRDPVERDLAPLFERIGLGLTTWSPLAGGLLTGKYGQGIPQGTRATLPGYEWFRAEVESEEGRRRAGLAAPLSAIASDLSCTLPQLAIAWCAKNPRVSTVILGSSRPAQVKENLRALEVVPKLTDEVMGRIDALLGNKPPQGPTVR